MSDFPDSIRDLRHAARHNLAGVFVVLAGEPGLDKDTRIARFDTALELIAAAAKNIEQAKQQTIERDDAKRNAEKAAHEAAQAATDEAFVEIIEVNGGFVPPF